MRAQFLRVLARPLADLEALDHRLDSFRAPVEVVTVTLDKVGGYVDCALDAAALGIGLAELLTTADGADDDEGDEP